MERPRTGVRQARWRRSSRVRLTGVSPGPARVRVIASTLLYVRP